MIERVLETLAANGIFDFILVIRPGDDEIQEYFRERSAFKDQIRYVEQPEQLGMGHAVACAAPMIRGDFVLSACDNLVTSQDVRCMLADWNNSPRPNGVLSLLQVPPEQISKTGIVELDGKWVTRIIEKPTIDQAPSDIASIPLYIFSIKILDYLHEVPLSSRGEYELQDAIQLLISRMGYVCGVRVSSRWTVTDADDLLALNRHFLVKERPHRVVAAGVGTEWRSPVYVEDGTSIGARCTIGPEVFIERGCKIGDGVNLAHCVVLRGAILPSGLDLSDQVMGGMM
jgi:bifunctional UDP-N-acetylglucosamine pyrophosphorylase/glucosamine-1-phosphate N-acetyltransferase